ncbi:MAG: hypothetical protein A2275_12945 [Bacteroidetes bacterium RIFOXYA12_FULL_35_11]|nr:MAG: hypothetical protein A2X01_05795 [Bacteroidetes bacterium GWF2_35_48]OFY72616.1 MAG: hypothetical protein A2275_12945 [Bacteroidetes bacterium RIFOXYA12_FULL_35_11]OFY93359.1 MAG: hypothetical protein A2491_06435 [Bacteroidetes bacterium RIFOXYC12_FULL_35_7]HBX52528.1 DoxX family protein [Bacteroidales bacterium]
MKMFKKILGIITSAFVGIVFVFSGFVKAVDPLGSTYKFIDYFEAFNLPSLDVTAFPLSIILSGLEFTIGLCLLIFIQRKWALWGALLFMIFFTPLTLWLALTDPVSDCGCFGDAWILTNWETFYKNLIILSAVIIAFVLKKNIPVWLSVRKEWIFTGGIAFLITLFSWYNYQHLPVIDFRPYKVGNYLPEKMVIPDDAPRDIYETFLTIRDTVSGKEIKIEMAQYSDDSTYWCEGSRWKYISSSTPKLIKKGYQAPIHDFNIVAENGDEITKEVLADSVYYFLLVAYDLKKSDTDRMADINKLYKQALAEGNKFISLTAVSNDVIEEFKKKNNPAYDFYITDGITLKTVVRSNPGLVLLKKGTVLAKWHNNDIPDYESIKKQYFK